MMNSRARNRSLQVQSKQDASSPRQHNQTKSVASPKHGGTTPGRASSWAFLALALPIGVFVFVLLPNMHHAVSVTKDMAILDAPSVATTSVTPFIEKKKPPVVIAHVVSLIKCGKQASVTGFLDAAAVLRHSIHKTSVHNPESGSKYSYQMYAVVHEEGCAPHAQLLENLGYKTLIRPTPVTDFEGEWYKNHVEGENCCGSKEFIKLFAYTLMDHPISVHWDMDVAILQPLDELYDSMLFPYDSPQGQAARAKVRTQHGDRVPLPQVIEAFFTKDLTSSAPWEIRQGVQGGFLVARTNPHYFQQYLDFIKKGNYIGPGRANNKGWAGMGYSGFQGAMAYQGVVSYFYEQIMDTRNNTFGAVELDGCRYNQVVADVIWRGPRNYESHHGQCRQYPVDGDFSKNFPEQGRCEDCRILPVEETKTVHYTACKKPWECRIPHPRVPRNKAETYRLNNLTNVTTCKKLFSKWFELRKDLEEQLQTIGDVAAANPIGKFESEAFLGYCKRAGDYIPMNPPPADFDIQKKLYGM